VIDEKRVSYDIEFLKTDSSQSMLPVPSSKLMTDSTWSVASDGAY
jgi:hypothetical protein